MKNYHKKIKDYETTNPLNLFYEFGITPDQVKQQIIDTFSPYFKNNESVENLSINYLVEPWLTYLTVYRDKPEYLKFIQTILDILNEAKLRDHEKALDNYVAYIPDFSQAISRFWSLYNSKTDIKKLCTEDYVEASLKIIGQTIEGMLKPFLKFLLQLNKIKRNKVSNFSVIQKIDLGDIIGELIDTSELKDLLIIGSENIRLNQWRNIAYHHNSKVLNDEIFLWYKKQDNYFEFNISKEELYQNVKDVLLIFKIIRIAEMIFCYDNLDEIQQKSIHSTDQVNSREESKLVDFFTSLSSQGFKINYFKSTDKIAVMKVQDMQDYGHFLKRAIHSSQFLYNLWLFTKSSKLEIDYYLFSGEKFFSSRIEESDFKDYIESANEELDISKILNDVVFTYLNSDYTQDLNPFADLYISEEIKNNSPQFYSQAGAKITIEQFCRQFVLSVFSNYLAFQSEGIKKGIKMNIGSDGAMVISEQPKAIVLHVPATIKSKELQTVLINLLAEVIDAFDAKKLQHEIVAEARENNNFYTKKAAIKDQLLLP